MEPLEITLPDEAASSAALLDGDEFLMLEESFRADDNDGDDEMDLDLLPLEPEPLPEPTTSSASVVAAWNNSAPCVMGAESGQQQARSSSFAVASPPSQPVATPSEDDLLRRLAASMRRSDETRSRLLEHGHGPAASGNGRARASRMSAPPALLAPQVEALRREEQVPQQSRPGTSPSSQSPAPRQHQRPHPTVRKFVPPSPVTASTTAATTRMASAQSILRLSGFLSGDLKTLTSGLEQSRSMVRRHGTMLLRGSHGGVLGV